MKNFYLKLEKLEVRYYSICIKLDLHVEFLVDFFIVAFPVLIS
jgi:hypothetical protein